MVGVHERRLFHNRLTHTLKVQQLSRSLSKALNANPDFASTRDAGVSPNVEVCQAGALGHDLGHPPFGHLGEEVLNNFSEEYGLDGFNGNAQSFRIVTKIAHRNSPKAGLQLSNPTLRAILKYPYLREGDWAEEKSWGAYLSERREFKEALGEDAPGTKTIEAEVIDWADDVTYGVHDVEDFYQAGFIPLEVLASDSLLAQPVREEFLGRVATWKFVDDKYDPDEGTRALHFLRGLLNPDSPWRATRNERRHLHRMSSGLITYFMTETEMHSSAPLIRYSKEIRHQLVILKQLTWQYVVHSARLASVQEGQRKLLKTLACRLLEWLGDDYEGSSSKSTKHRLPTQLRHAYEDILEDPDGRTEIEKLAQAKGKDPANALRARAVADLTANLTESQAGDLFERLEGLNPGSVADTWLQG